MIPDDKSFVPVVDFDDDSVGNAASDDTARDDTGVDGVILDGVII